VTTTTETTTRELNPSRVFALLGAQGLDMTTDPDYPATAVHVFRDGFGITIVKVTGHNTRRQAQTVLYAARVLAEHGYTVTAQVDGHALALVGYSDPQRKGLTEAVVEAAAHVAKVLGLTPAQALVAVRHRIDADAPTLTLRIQAELDRANLARFVR
jgi:hypothetical protein